MTGRRRCSQAQGRNWVHGGCLVAGTTAGGDISLVKVTSGGAADWLLLALAHHRLGDTAKARTWYDRAITWMDEHPGDPELERFRAEADALPGLAE